jgi:UDPglucose--hexose-1-phosphate uridylyltransferase
MTGKLIEQLLLYAQTNLDLKGFDVTYTRNILMQLLKETEPFAGRLSQEEEESIKRLDVPDYLLEKLCQVIKEKKLSTEGAELNFASLIMSLLSPTPENLVNKFNQIKSEQGVRAACAYLLEICVKNNYIQKTAIGKNIIWRADFEDNYLEITINMSKPEKDNRDILRQFKQGSSSYPKCMLCMENLGFEGSLTKPPRQNLRYVPVKIGGENWFMQYSPYMYYNEHCIVISENHTPMKVDKSTITKLLDFIDLFPNYFIGSNASLPIVGGSILSHEHFQGGGHKMPLHNALDRKYYDKNLKNVKMSSVKWYNSVIRLKSASRKDLFNAASRVFDAWENYNDASCDIVSRTTERHNALTPVLRKENGEYILEIILRNNRTSAEYPDGIFHAHPEHHNIKKEGIGLIEAMGLFILPPRLKRETEEIKGILCGKREYGEDLSLHKNMIDRLCKKYKNTLNEAAADKAVKDYINNTCKDILINTAVFKPDDKGIKAFDRFIEII